MVLKVVGSSPTTHPLKKAIAWAGNAMSQRTSFCVAIAFGFYVTWVSHGARMKAFREGAKFAGRSFLFNGLSPSGKAKDFDSFITLVRIQLAQLRWTTSSGGRALDF